MFKSQIIEYIDTNLCAKVGKTKELVSEMYILGWR